MIVSPTEPFKLVFSLYQHEFLGYLLEPYVVKLTLKGEFSFQSQNISGTNVKDFKAGLTRDQVRLVELTSKIQQDIVFRKFNTNKKLKRDDFFKKIFDPAKGDPALREAITLYIDNYRKEIYRNIRGENFFIMGSDGIPTWKEVEIVEEPAKVYFHFNREEEKTIYYPIIKCNGEKVKFQFRNGLIINDIPAVLLIDNLMYIFEDHVDGKKLRPFLQKSNIEIPRKIEDTYYKKFIVPLIANFNVYAQGFDISYEKEEFITRLQVTEVKAAARTGLFGTGEDENPPADVILELIFSYGDHDFKFDNFSDPAYVYPEKTAGSWKFHKIKRNLPAERAVISFLKNEGLDLRNGRSILPKNYAVEWISDHLEKLEAYPVIVQQSEGNSATYFLGYSHVDVKVVEKNDWFDIEAEVIFGEFRIPFKKFRHYILNNIKEFALPDGRLATIPEAWFKKFSELFESMDEADSADAPRLRKQFIGLVNLLAHDGVVTTQMNRKLSALSDFEEIQDAPLPQKFEGELRPYQKAGYNWLLFLKEYGLGGCLADDMGLGKTVTTLAFLQKIKEEKPGAPSLLVLPTSLIYNWQKEAARFTPDLRVMVHYGTQRSKDTQVFALYDLIICSYGVLRSDIDFIRYFRFNYAILDESQSIKNAASANFKAVMDLNTQNRLILTGTPLENSTLDLWSQMSFINPGLLGSFSAFKKKYQSPIEKEKDEASLKVLSARIRPFMLRRNKRQVAQDLPEKIESVVYCQMTEEQEKLYDETRSYVRNQIMGMQENGTLGKSGMLVLQGLSKLRQLANHPAMVSAGYRGESGKGNDVMQRIREVVQEGSKTLVFSQFVKHLEFVAEALRTEGIPFLYLDGSTKNRMELVDRFQQQDSEQVFLISLKAGGVGLNLTAAENVFILDPWWNPAIEAQAVDRAHRIGQTKTVFSYKFITQNTIEEKIVELQNTKKQLFDELIIEEEGFFKSLTTEDILSLIE
ncbi:SNF2-related protein [Leadbetterella sp. DM7]|uniref:DEAD/DEAH box helicase n=1 Tax=Leadbetterella sp. DM7 TaxID=3235085 RepID=UPI00349EF663